MCQLCSLILVSGKANLPDVDLTTFAVYIVYAWNHNLKVTGNLPRDEAHRSDAAGEKLGNVTEGHTDERKEGDRQVSLRLEQLFQWASPQGRVLVSFSL
jgi:hypothetical protein